MPDSERSLLIVVPRTGLEASRSLRRAFGEDSTVQVIVDRRLMERRIRAGAYRPERRRGDRRLRSDAEAELKGERWVAVPRASGHVDVREPDARAILFLCCSQHVVPCQRCQNTYRLGWIAQAESGVFPCPLCGNDLTQIVVAHAQTCPYWANRLQPA